MRRGLATPDPGRGSRASGPGRPERRRPDLRVVVARKCVPHPPDPRARTVRSQPRAWVRQIRIRAASAWPASSKLSESTATSRHSFGISLLCTRCAAAVNAPPLQRLARPSLGLVCSRSTLRAANDPTRKRPPSRRRSASWPTSTPPPWARRCCSSRRFLLAPQSTTACSASLAWLRATARRASVRRWGNSATLSAAMPRLRRRSCALRPIPPPSPQRRAARLQACASAWTRCSTSAPMTAAATVRVDGTTMTGGAGARPDASRTCAPLQAPLSCGRAQVHL